MTRIENGRDFKKSGTVGMRAMRAEFHSLSSTAIPNTASHTTGNGAKWRVTRCDRGSTRLASASPDQDFLTISTRNPLYQSWQRGFLSVLGTDEVPSLSDGGCPVVSVVFRRTCGSTNGGRNSCQILKDLAGVSFAFKEYDMVKTTCLYPMRRHCADSLNKSINNWRQSTMKKVIGILALFLLVIGLIAPPAYACYGVRAMGMGGAFIAVADDVNTVYWNPAGLSNIKATEIGLQHMTNNRDSLNYIDVIEYVTPLKKGISGIGFHYTNNRDTAYFGVSEDTGYTNYKSDWFTFSYGTKVTDNFAVGINVRQVKDSASDATINGIVQSKSYSASNTGIDLGFLGTAGKLSYGMLVQDANKPKALFGSGEMERNYRPGIAYRPDNKTIIAFDAYDVKPSEGSKTEYSIGVEHKISNEVCARIGNYHGAMTYGAGVKIDKNIELNVAYLSGNLGGTTLIGLQAKY